MYQVSTFINVAFALYGTVLLCILAVLWLIRRLGLLDKRTFGILSVTALMVLTVLGCLVSLVFLQDERLTRAYLKEDLRTLGDHVHEQRAEIQGAIRKFVQFGDPRAYIRYWEMLAYAQHEVEETSARLGLGHEQVTQLMTIFARDTELAQTEEIAMLLTVWAYDLPEASFPEVAHLQWEPHENFHRQHLQFPNRKYWPVSRRNDMKLTDDEKAVMARYILFDTKYDYDWHHAIEPVEKLIKQIDDDAHRAMVDIEQLVDTMAGALIGGTVLFMCASIGMIMFLMGKILDLRAAGINLDDIGQQRHDRSCCSGVLMCFCCVVVRFGVACFDPVWLRVLLDFMYFILSL